MNTFESLAARHALASRRGFVDPNGGLSAVGLALLALQSDVTVTEQSNCTPAGSAALHEAHQTESRVIGLYQDVLESGVLDMPGRTLAVLFQRHHLLHLTALDNILRTRSTSQVSQVLGAAHAALGDGIAAPLNPQAALIQLAQLERASCQMHMEASVRCSGDEQAPLLTRLAVKCAVHYGALAQATGEPLELS